MTEEEKKAIEYIKKEIDYFKTTILGFEKEMEDKDWLRKNVLELKNDISARETILNLIQKQDTEINKLNKVIDRMVNIILVKELGKYACRCDEKYDCKKVKEGYRDYNCKQCIKEYFMKEDK